MGALFIPLYFMTLALIVLSSLMYYVEQTTSLVCHLSDGVDGEEVVNPWDSANTTRGNEGCQVDYGCECPGKLGYVTYDGEECAMHPHKTCSLETMHD